MITFFNLRSLLLIVAMEATDPIGPSDVAQMDLDELKSTNRRIELDSDELEFPSMTHHMTVRGKLEALVDKDVINYTEMQSVYDRWKGNKQ